MTEPQKLLADYANYRSEEAFGQLVKCYVDLVYSTALRLVGGDSHLAEDVVQTVFLHLANKASRLPRDVMLGGWLHRDTCFVASKMLRSERRRRFWERQALELTMTTNDSADFSEIAPNLDEAINQLGEDDRKAILLRFYERLDFRRIGEQLGSNEDAAQKRVSRALEQLNSRLVQRGVGATLSVATLGTALAARAVETAPAGLIESLAKAALTSAGAGPGTAVTFLKHLTTSKIGVGVASAVVLAAATGLAWSVWWPWQPAKPTPLALNGTWTRLNKPQPLGCILSGLAFALDRPGDRRRGARANDLPDRHRRGSRRTISTWWTGTRSLVPAE
jgi:RNA polymerase sigma factor (sigma-70 family)